nr:PREDICTED: RNA-binding protein 25 [Megachile rotundata]
MSLRELFFNLSLKLRLQNIVGKRCFSSKSVSNIFETAEEKPIYVEEEEESVGLEEKRNKSRLNPGHRNILCGQKPYDNSLTWYHNTIKYKKRTLGRYGIEALGTTAGLAWPTLEEVQKIKEYEKVAFPLTIQERLSKIKEEKGKHQEFIMARQQEIELKMANMEKMISDIQEKIDKKKQEMLEARQKKERRIEEIRRKLLAEGHVSASKIEKTLEKMDKEERKKKKEMKKALIMEKKKQWAIKMLGQSKQKDETGENVEESKEDNEKV